ncbi:PPE family protein [Mycobacterium celatum]|uniref:PPE family protein n=2 Tax=Mycobacterium celatum TaxID=28045 RepID=A0A1X1RRC6_MYCCE|nr:PPE family protein [Mycobacterium celatum]ORV13424.1 hypothetical protein AWB95_11335 [Mycobacterium celatum]PIB78149.1 PPE family protein [Mycobacterium celatum]
MTAPIWMASPPEVHSALLSSGPGPESLLAAAGVWNSLSVEYESAAEELSSLLAAVQTGAWQGPSAESYVAAHVPYLAWLMHVSANSAATATQHETVAAAYTAALATMPTLAELAGNHAMHAVLVATNFFGINTIPIALNEADYARMWVQAATTMTTYQAVSSTAVASTPQTDPAPVIQKTNGNNNSGGSQDEGPGPTDPSWWTERLGKIGTAIENELLHPSPTNAEVLYQIFTYWIPRWGGEVYLTFAPQLTQLSELSFGLIAPAIPMAGAAGLAGLAGLPQSASVSTPEVPAVAAAPAPADIQPVAGITPSPAPTPAAAQAAAPAPATAPTASAVATTGPPAPPPPGGAGFAYPYVVGPPGVGTGAPMSVRAGAKMNASEPDSAAVGAAAATREDASHRRRRTKAKQLGRGYEYMDLEPDVAASDQGAGTLGFAGTARKAGAGQAAGLTTLADDALSGPAMPMMPSSWGTDTDHPDTS